MAMQLERVDGGSLRNAIPRESKAVVTIPKSRIGMFKKYIAMMTEVFKAEYGATDPNLEITVESARMPEKVMYRAAQRKFLDMIYMIDNGIYRMDSNIAGLVQTSNNLARVLVKLGEYSVQCLTRSSVNTEKMDLTQKIELTMQTASSRITITKGGEYPGWTPNPHAKIVEIMVNLYKEMNDGAAPTVSACHAGLECGILGKNYPKMEMISFGPTIRGAHSPDEAASISSTQKFWKYLLATLAAIPERA